MGMMRTRRAHIALGVAMAAALTAFAAPSYGQSYDCRSYAYMPGKNDKPTADSGDALAAYETLILQARTSLASPAGQQTGINPTELLTRARGGCEGLLKARNGKRNIRAQACFGDAAALLANDAATRATAYCAYDAVHQLASRDKANYAKNDATALVGQARLLKAASDRGGAIRAYQDAIILQPDANPSWYIDQAEIEKDDRQLPAAAGTYAKLFAPERKFTNFTVADQARARMEQARLSSGATARDFWNKAIEVLKQANLPGAVEGYYNIGMIDFRAGSPNARTSFGEAVKLTAGTQEQGRFKAESFYYLALLDARDLAAMDPKNARASGRWKDVQRNANDAGVSVPAAARLACIAFIADGDKASLESRTDVAPAAACTNGDGSPEAKLLQGLYAMRRAQFVPLVCTAGQTTPCSPTLSDATRDRVNYLDRAIQVFNEATTLASGASPRVFDWLQDGQQTSLVALLQAGKDMAFSARAVVNGQCSVLPPPQAVEKLFKTVDLLECKPPHRR